MFEDPKGRALDVLLHEDRPQELRLLRQEPRKPVHTLKTAEPSTDEEPPKQSSRAPEPRQQEMITNKTSQAQAADKHKFCDKGPGSPCKR